MKPKKKRNKSILFRLFVLGVCAYFTVTLATLWGSLNKSRAELAALNAEYEQTLLDIEELKALLESESDDQLIEKAARERLGYAYPEEQVFIDYSGM